MIVGLNFVIETRVLECFITFCFVAVVLLFFAFHTPAHITQPNTQEIIRSHIALWLVLTSQYVHCASLKWVLVLSDSI